MKKRIPIEDKWLHKATRGWQGFEFSSVFLRPGSSAPRYGLFRKELIHQASQGQPAKPSPPFLSLDHSGVHWQNTFPVSSTNGQS